MDIGHCGAIQTDQKIVVAGYGNQATTGYDFIVARYNPDGSLDTTFSQDGYVRTDFNQNDDYGLGVIIQNDNKIVVAGQTDLATGSMFALARYNPDGTLVFPETEKS